MGISSFAAGYLKSATERLKTREKETRDINNAMAERKLKEIMKGQEIEKARKKEIRDNLRAIDSSTGGETLSQNQKVIIAADSDRFKRFLKFAQRDPSGILIKEQIKEVQGADFKNMTLAQKVELFAKQDVPEVSPGAKQTATAFGLPLGDTDASIKKAAAMAGMTEEKFLAGTSRPTDALPEFKEDLSLDPSETLAQKQDRISSLIVNEKNKGDKANPDFLKYLSKELTEIKRITEFEKAKQSDVRANLKLAMAGVEEQLIADNLGMNIPGEGFVLNYQITPAQARKAGEQYQQGVRFLLDDYLKDNGIKPTNNIQNDINQLPDEIRQPFLSVMPQFTMSTLQSLAKNRRPVNPLPSKSGPKDFSVNNKTGIRVSPRYSSG